MQHPKSGSFDKAQSDLEQVSFIIMAQCNNVVTLLPGIHM